MGATSPAESESMLLANLCGISQDTLYDLPLKDYKLLQTAFLGFLA
ncbi:phage tail assembly protein [Oxalobacter vibrioformis]